jgi:prepilin-type N-terminal cleavage/methylation domain-containing protein
MKRKQSGFTLIEIAIVLVIIGLLLGGVLKGQELINSAKVKNLANDFRNVPVYIYGYQDKFKALPGDDRQADVHLGTSASCAGSGTCPVAAPPAFSTVGDGLIEGMWNSTTVTDESYLFWQHVRLAGFAAGSVITGAPDYIPKNAVGGSIGVTNSLAANSPIINPNGGLKGTYVVCSDNIPGRFALQLDATLDDGNPATGSMMVAAVGTTSGATAVTTATIIPDQTYLVCMGF